VSEAALPFQIAAARRILHREGCDSGVLGLISARIEGEDAIWTNAMEYADETTPDTLVRVPLSGVESKDAHRVSPAVLVHLAIYARRPDVQAVVHTHSHHAAVVSSTEQVIGMFNEMSTMYFQDQVCYTDSGEHTPAAAALTAQALGDKRVMLLKGHGIIAAAPSLPDAAMDAVTLEKTARWHLQSTAFHGNEIVLAHTEQIKPLYNFYFRSNMWAANVRRLRKSDPDLFDYVTV
jgi:L-fuculose-phosphate aldolase